MSKPTRIRKRCKADGSWSVEVVVQKAILSVEELETAKMKVVVELVHLISIWLHDENPVHCYEDVLATFENISFMTHAGVNQLCSFGFRRPSRKADRKPVFDRLYELAGTLEWLAIREQEMKAAEKEYKADPVNYWRKAVAA